MQLCKLLYLLPGYQLYDKHSFERTMYNGMKHKKLATTAWQA